MKDIEYIVYIPGGNDTAFVTKSGFTKEEKKKINDEIMKNTVNVEQVGFVDKTKKNELEMAGGEFCGNATRSAAYYYLNGKPGNIEMIVNSKDIIKAGVYENGDAWCEIPLYHGSDVIIKKEDGIYQVRMNGMVSIIVDEVNSKKYLENKETIKEEAMKFIQKYDLLNEEAVGVMFTETIDGIKKINPIVWVKEIDTLFYETACGSGTTATAMLESYLKKQDIKINILQPSGYYITADVKYENEKINNVVIPGKIQTDNKIYRLSI